MCGQSAGCRKSLSQEGLSEDIKGYPLPWMLWKCGAFAQGGIASGGGEGKRAQTPLSFLYIKKNKIHPSHKSCTFL